MAPKPSHSHWNNWNSGFPWLRVLWFHTLAFIKMSDSLGPSNCLPSCCQINVKLYPMAYSRHLFYNIYRSQYLCSLSPFNKSDFIWIVDSKNIFVFGNFLKQIFLFLKPCKETKCKKVLQFVCCFHAMPATRPSLFFCWPIEGTGGCMLAVGSWQLIIFSIIFGQYPLILSQIRICINDFVIRTIEHFCQFKDQ